ncbi:AAA family ATPase, partial [Lactobacillus delbrueckii]
MAKIVTVTTQKGGAGKTTLALLLATGEALRGERVL